MSSNNNKPLSDNSAVGTPNQNDYSVANILGHNSMEIEPGALYEPFISSENTTYLNDFLSNARARCEKINELTSEIHNILAETNSNKIYGSYDKEIINDVSFYSKEFLHSLNNPNIADIETTIKKYNELLKQIKSITRRKLLEEKVDEINGKRTLVSTNTQTIETIDSMKVIKNTDTCMVIYEGVLYTDGIYLIEIKNYLDEEAIAANRKKSGNKVVYKHSETKYIFISLEYNISIEEIENRIIATNNTLPYDKSKVIMKE